MTIPLQERALRHGHCANGRPSPTYTTWAHIVQRCTNPKNKAWKNYGGRGITVCDRWRDSFDAFVDDMGEKPAGLSIDRIDNERGYEPGNCRWATRAEQHANKRPSSLQQPPEIEAAILVAIERGEDIRSIVRRFQVGKDLPRVLWRRHRPDAGSIRQWRARTGR